METLRRAGLTDVQPGHPLQVRVAPGHKGPLAVVAIPIDAVPESDEGCG